MKSFTVIVCSPKAAPYVSIIKGDTVDTLRELQVIVGGSIETCARRNCGTLTLDAYCNEDEPETTPPNRMMPNGQPVRGTVVVTAANAKGETVSLEGEHLAQAMAWAESWLVNMSSPEDAAAHGHKCGPKCLDAKASRKTIDAELCDMLDAQTLKLKASMRECDPSGILRHAKRLSVMVDTLIDAVGLSAAISGILDPKEAPKRDSSKES